MKRVLSRSASRKLGVTVVAMVGFVMAYDAAVFDSRETAGAPQAALDPTAPAAGTRQLFSATAYCKGTTTASGVGVRTGIAASDPALLPVGSVINVSTGLAKYNGVYTIMDTGPKVQGRIIDLYMWSCHEALAFGRQQIELTVLRLGWNPSASTPSLVDRLFRRREIARNAPTPVATGGATVADGPVTHGAKVSDGAMGATGASEGATGAIVPSEGAAGGTVPAPSEPAPSNLAPSDAPSAPIAPSPTLAPSS
jgi:3D (Asp-Asp-Asp) domain-containing protein